MGRTENSSPPMKPGSSLVGMPLQRILLIGLLTTSKSFPIDTPWKDEVKITERYSVRLQVEKESGYSKAIYV